MSEIRDRVREHLVNEMYEILGGDKDFDREAGFHPCADLAEEIVDDKILSTPELAIVDREAELPKFDYEKHLITYSDYKFTQDEMLKAGFVKEVK